MVNKLLFYLRAKVTTAIKDADLSEGSLHARPDINKSYKQTKMLQWLGCYETNICYNISCVLFFNTFNDGYSPFVFRCPRTFAQSCCKLGRNASPEQQGKKPFKHIFWFSNITVKTFLHPSQHIFWEDGEYYLPHSV